MGNKFRFTHNKLGLSFLFSYFVVVISGMVFMAMTDDKLNSYSSGKELLLTALLWQKLPWKPPWNQYVGNRGLKFSLLYGDVLIIVEDWSFQFFFLSRESLYGIQFRLTSIDPSWKVTNVIQQRKQRSLEFGVSSHGRYSNVKIALRRFRRKFFQILIMLYFILNLHLVVFLLFYV